MTLHGDDGMLTSDCIHVMSCMHTFYSLRYMYKINAFSFFYSTFHFTIPIPLHLYIFFYNNMLYVHITSSLTHLSPHHTDSIGSIGSAGLTSVSFVDIGSISHPFLTFSTSQSTSGVSIRLALLLSSII